jgi:hypothetical protein
LILTDTAQHASGRIGPTVSHDTCAACETATEAECAASATETERADQKGMYLVTWLFFFCASSDLDLDFALPLSFFSCDLLAWFVGFFSCIERGKEERMQERVLIARLLPPPFLLTLIPQNKSVD